MQIQTEMTERALELLNLDPVKGPYLLMDIGCGTGLSGEVVSENGNHWFGFDISPSMLGNYACDESTALLQLSLEVAVDRDAEGDLFLHDMGQGFSFRPGSFDGAIR